jgi:hypothetical protein
MKKEAKTLTEAVLQVMDEVKNIDKTLTVGEGKMSYKGIADKDVKLAVGQAMAKAGLIILPKAVKYNSATVSQWQENSNYGTRQRQSIFTEVVVSYELRHISGESVELQGYGHGVDNQDKGAGKAMTYALKTLLLYTFMIPTGKIDDTDATHSNDMDVPAKSAPVKKLRLTDSQFNDGLTAISEGRYTVEEMLNDYLLTPEQTEQLPKK